MDVAIQQATLQDWKTIQTLDKELFDDNAAYDRYLNVDWPLTKNGIAHVKKAAAGNKTCCLLAICDNKPIGYLYGGAKKVAYRKLKIAEIYELGVSLKYRSNGIGKRLVEEFKTWCGKNGYEMIMVSSYFDNARAVEFYKKCGLTPTDVTLELKL